MIEFKQKEFLAPVIAAALIGAGGTGASIISGKKQTAAQNESQERVAKMQAAQAKKIQKAQEEEAKKDRALQEKQLKAAQKQEKDLIKLAKRNPAAAAAVKPTAVVTANVNPNQQQQQNQQQNQQPQQVTYSAGILLSAGSAGIEAVSSGLRLKATKKEAKENLDSAKADLNSATKESEQRIKAANDNSKAKTQALKNSKKAFKAELTQAKQMQKAYTDYSSDKEILGFAKNLKKIASERGVKKTIMKTAVGGATVVGAKYLVDKAIQRDIKKSGLEKVNEETPEQVAARKKARKRALLVGAGTTAAAVGAGIAAKKGAFGNHAQKWASAKLSKAGAKKALKGVKNGFIDAYTKVDDNGNRKLNKFTVGLTTVGVAAPAVKYALTKRAHKKQIQQSQGEEEIQDKNTKQPENRTYSNIKFPKIQALNKNQEPNTEEETPEEAAARKKKIKRAALIGTGVTAATTVGAVLGAKYIRNANLTKDSPKWLRNTKASLIKFKRAPGQVVLGKVSDSKGGGGRKGVVSFGAKLEEYGKNNNNALSQKVGKFISKNPKTALLGSIGVGVGIAKVGGLGEKAATKALRTVDKNAFAYKDRGTTFVSKEQPNDQQEQIEETSTPKKIKKAQPKEKSD